MAAEPGGGLGGTGSPIEWSGEKCLGAWLQDAAYFAEQAEGRGNAIEHVERDGALEMGGGERKTRDVGTPKGDVFDGEGGDGIVNEIEDKADATAGVTGAAGAAGLLGDAEHGEIEIDAYGELTCGGSEFEGTSAEGAADIEPEAGWFGFEKLDGGIKNVEISGAIGGPVGVSVDAVVAAVAVHGGSGAGEVTEERFGEGCEVAAAEGVLELVFGPGGGVGEEDGDAVDDGVFTLAEALLAEERAFQNVGAFLAGDVGEPQGRIGLMGEPAEGADRLDLFAVVEAHERVSRR